MVFTIHNTIICFASTINAVLSGRWASKLNFLFFGEIICPSVWEVLPRSYDEFSTETARLRMFFKIEILMKRHLAV